MGQPVAMFEIVSTDHERLGRFYEQLFDWKVDGAPGDDGYALVDTQSEPIPLMGGIRPSMGEGDTGVKFYVRVDDLAAYLDRAEQLGGARLVEPTELPDGFGTFAMFTDPDGNTVGLWA
ncbi:hypothetical protein CLV46_1705 [Diaminobutyricimonas aerilata]|uniref:VOC domain-containing protein n=1 Tax=Diaminobutyricimonas aerilata TaxID=1162967 RepID=A0A2M9CJS1_9MICO|nr:VOC family protein [Diaminobutyricimonas aerilata]PJJ72141.1 hypothetical protein CLV46_1705 [Diaminobutyricimonas aerilata]